MSEAISGGIANCTKGRKKILLENLKDLLSAKRRTKAAPIEGRWAKRKRLERYAKKRGEELCCLLSDEEVREMMRIDRKRRTGGLTKKQRKASRRLDRKAQQR